jgi:beta-1,4-mannosyl-glycoprotein beta-1,4-N-acetylglucosaminyltransferase
MFINKLVKNQQIINANKIKQLKINELNKKINDHNEKIRKSKTRKIFDCFIFYNENDMINYRLNILNDVVDYFIIVESTHTFSGKEKKLHSEDLKELFNEFKDKIIHIIVEDLPFKYPNINIDNGDQWKNEIFQRNCIKRGLEKANISDDDFIIIADADEISDKNTLKKIKNNDIPVFINTLEMDFYYYNLNCKIKNKWNSTKIVLYRLFKEKNLDCEYYRGYNCPIIKNGGWHLSYFGDKYFIKNKIENFSHQEYNKSEFTDLTKIENNMKKSNDLFYRKDNLFIKISINQNNYLPTDYDKYLKKFINT